MSEARAGLVRQAWRHAIVRAPESAPAYLSLAKLSPQADAFRFLGRAWAVAGTSSEVTRAYAQGAFLARESGRARAALLAMLALEVRAETLADLGVIEARLGLDAAAGRFRRALALSPALLGAHFSIGNRGEQAERRYRRALALDPRHGGALVNLANLWRDGPRLDEAVALLKRAVVLQPGDAIGLYNLANARHVSGDASAAARDYRAALAIENRDAWRLREATLLPPIPDTGDEIAEWRRRFAERVERLVPGLSVSRIR